MKKSLLKLFVILPYSSLLLLGCGGGGGSSTPNYAGSWNTSVTLVSNSCARQIPAEFQYLSALHNVNQSSSEDSLGNQILDIVLEDGIDTYVGVGQIGSEAQGDSFSATGSPHELPGFLNSYLCIEVINFDYDSITEDENGNMNAGFVTRHSSISCRRGTEIKTCDVTYTGSAYGYR